MQAELIDPETASAMMSSEQGIWVLVAIILLRWVSQLIGERKGPHWVSNGVMESVIDKLSKRVGAEISDLPANRELTQMLKTNQEIAQSMGLTLDHILAYHAKYNEEWPRMVDHAQECAERQESTAKSLEKHGKVLKAVARELNSSRLCAYRPHDAAALAKDVERKRRIEDRTRSEDLGIDLEELE